MKHRIVIFAAATVAASLSGCGGGGAAAVATTPSVPGMTIQSLDTVQVLTQARETSETDVPFAVNEGELVLSDTSDVADSLSFTAT